MGFVVDRWFAAGRRDAHLLFYAGAAIVQIVTISGAMLVSSPTLAVALLVPYCAAANFSGLAAAALQIVTPSQLRGRMSAIYLLVFNLMGIGLGPSVVALLTDFVFHDDAQVGSAILISCVACSLASAALLVSAAPSMRRSILQSDPAAAQP